jgi:hypothetical protein
MYAKGEVREVVLGKDLISPFGVKHKFPLSKDSF